MTDELTGGAAAPADNTAAPAASEQAVSLPNPISTESAVASEATKDKVPSIDDALDRAAAKVEKANAGDKGKDEAAKDAAKPVKSDAPVRDQTGKFAPKEGDKTAAVAAQPGKDATVAKDATQTAQVDASKPAGTTTAASDAPARFSPDAKAEWAKAPDPVKAEVARMERELTAGIEKHRASAEAFEPVRKFDEMAKKSGTTLETALTRFVNIEQLCKKDIVAGLNEVCRNMNLSLRDVAAHVLGQTPDQRQSSAEAENRQLLARIAQLEQKVGGVSQTIEQQQQAAVMANIDKFAVDHPRTEELANDITFFLETGRAKTLQEAYDLAERLNPGQAQAQASAVAQTQAASSALAPDPQAQTLKGQKSINGAPNPGSNPGAKKRSTSIDDAVDRAFATAS